MLSYGIAFANAREKHIQQIKDCGKYIIDHAEEIYGDFEIPVSLRITVNMEPKGFPTINAERTFYSPDLFRG